jgi:hypothetical protein
MVRFAGVAPRYQTYCGACCAVAFALVQYAKPYTRSDGAHKHGRQGYALPEPEFSADDLELHRRMLNLRRQVLTHSDLTLKEASVYVGPD